jgi:hypothetical protein
VRIRDNSRFSILLGAVLATVFAYRWQFGFPFWHETVNPNYETFATYGSYLIFAREKFHFPFGQISGLGYPLQSVNIGTTGCIPLLALLFKFLGLIFGDKISQLNYVPIAEITAVGFSSWLIARFLELNQVRHRLVQAFAATLIALSHPLIMRSLWGAHFDVLAFPLFLAWFYAVFRWGSGDRRGELTLILLLPIAALVDFYACIGIILMTCGALVVQALFNVKLALRVGLKCALGLALTLVCLYLIGMYPAPEIGFKFSSFDFGLGGRYHVGDLLGPFIAQKELVPTILGTALAAQLGYPWTSDRLSPGQFVGISFVGTAGLVFFVLSMIFAFYKFRSYFLKAKVFASLAFFKSSYWSKPAISPWILICGGVFIAYVYSLGFLVHLMGHPLESIPLTPAGILTELVPTLFNIRAHGRLMIPSTMLVILGSAVLISPFLEVLTRRQNQLLTAGIATLMIIHIVEVGPVLANPLIKNREQFPIQYSVEEANLHRRIFQNSQAIFFAPTVKAADQRWVKEAYSLAATTNIPSNIFYLARPSLSDLAIINSDLQDILHGRLTSLYKRYGHITIILHSDIASTVLKSADRPIESGQLSNRNGVLTWIKL